jgi:indole-3-glycerol phosphate synthase
MHVAGTFEVDTANTNMLLEKRGDIIKKKRIQVGFRFKTT